MNTSVHQLTTIFRQRLKKDCLLQSSKSTAVKVVSSLCLLTAATAFAQDAGSLLRDAERQRQAPVPASPAILAPAIPPTPQPVGPRFLVSQFHLEGYTLLSEADLQAVLSSWVGRELSFAELQQATDAITERYRRAGYLVRAYLPEQKLDSGKVNIIIIEARMGKVQIEEGGVAQRISQEMARDTLSARQKTGDLFNLEHLQRGINLVNDIPGAEATLILSPSQKPTETDVIMKVKDKPLLSGTVLLDNNGSRSTGVNKLSGNFSLDNPTKIGDQIQLASAFTTGSNYLRLGYSIPIGHDGLRAGVHTSALQYNIPLLKANGTAATWGFDARYPLVRGSTDNLAVIGTFDTRRYLNNVGENVTSDKVMNVTSVGLSGDHIDAYGGGGFSFSGISLTVGTLDLSANAADLAADALPGRNGSFSKITWNIGRLQKLSSDTNLWLSANGQFAGKNLDSSESFSLGGPAGVRAYPNQEGSGDEGWLITAEVRHTLNSKLMLAGFYDHGRVVQHKNEWAGWNTGSLAGQPASYDLKGLGVSLTWSEPGNYTAKLAWAHRLDNNPLALAATGNDGDGTKVLDRLWLNLVKYF
ncbi:MAG: ShlB/FhaC/HecB family hemolysin secretion/activation protein [Rhodoferax sp.]|uniref:ShlB/FhaC/HecB family hemolysin secretion/activation protein n=1 Tax=Rhodoferax sp. TaxID=50421 RepID=UPI00301A203D